MSLAVWGGLLLLSANNQIEFNRDVRPIMVETCFRCHGQDKTTRMTDMRLDIREGAIKKTKSGVVPIVPGDSTKSAIIDRIVTEDPHKIMPPPYFRKTLTAQQKRIISQWVTEGAQYKIHWAYIPIERPGTPLLSPPKAPTHNPIDNFIQHRLLEKNMQPSPESDRRTLIRRLALDLTGIPPTPEEIDNFIRDRGQKAYEKLVDRFLSSQRYAEKQAIHWLDAVRYADTAGFHGDNPFPIWPYRDYILRAFRDNKPFDQFTIEQIAGDLLPNATVEQKVASAYNRLNRVSAEGGIQNLEYLAKYASDRVRTTSAVWLGATVGCAECHNHKFDPITAKDFYSMKAFFADIKETGFVFDEGPNAWGVQISLPTEEQKDKLEKLQHDLTKARKNLEVMTHRLIARKPKWEKENTSMLQYQNPISAHAANGAKLIITNDGTIKVGGPNPDNETYTVALKPGQGIWTTLGIQVLTDEQLPGQSVSRGSDRLVITEIEAEMFYRRLPIILAASASGEYPQGHPPMAAIDGKPKSGWGITSTKNSGNTFLFLRFAKPVHTTADSVLTVRLRHDSDYRRATMGQFRLALSSGNKLPKPSGLKDTQDKSKTDTNFQWSIPQLRPFLAKVWKLEAKLNLLNSEIPRVMVTEATTPTETRILSRGNWMDESGEVIEPAVPIFLGNLTNTSERPTRLDLANWIISSQNPLTARVFVNRLWKQFFGTGLVKTLDDFGLRGEWPSHPELLDWLAAEFMQPTFGKNSTNSLHPWNIKHIIQTIVTSHTYRQSSRNTNWEEYDPENRLFIRQNRFRVDAEAVRDIALAVSGLLVEKFGGPSVRPYQPEGYLSFLNFPRREYSASRGPDLYRRSIYTFWQRTFLHPTLQVFDAPGREECTVERINSNTPMQALTLLNDQIFVEAARVFAQNILRHGGPTLDQQIKWAFERATGRLPSGPEIELLKSLRDNALDEFEKMPAEASRLINVGEYPANWNDKPTKLAAMTIVSRAILNLHEVITRN